MQEMVIVKQVRKLLKVSSQGGGFLNAALRVPVCGAAQHAGQGQGQAHPPTRPQTRGGVQVPPHSSCVSASFLSLRVKLTLPPVLRHEEEY
jgi:hypothetical protein